MPETIYTSHDQTLWDVAIKSYSSIEGVFALLKDNGFESLEHLPDVGKMIVIDTTKIFKNKFENRLIKDQAASNYKTVALNDQSIWDMCIQEYGSIEQMFNLVQDNDILKSMDSILLAGDVLLVRRDFPGDYSSMLYFRNKRKVITGNGTRSGGIGHMRIGGNFIVS